MYSNLQTPNQPICRGAKTSCRKKRLATSKSWPLLPKNKSISANPCSSVAGLGRGATGFTTRSDLGPAREGPSEDQIKEALAKRAAALGNAPPTAYGVNKKKQDEEAEEDQFQDAENEEGLFATGNYDRDDDEADRIYQTVDERMDKRRKSRR